MAGTYRFPNITEKDVNKVIADTKSKNTAFNTKWALGVFEQWRAERNTDGDNVPSLSNMSKNELNCALARFVVACRKSDKSEFPPNSLYQICCGISRFLKEKDPNVNIMNTNNNDFFLFP